jgi:hypothetical protein
MASRFDCFSSDLTVRILAPNRSINGHKNSSKEHGPQHLLAELGLGLCKPVVLFTLPRITLFHKCLQAWAQVSRYHIYQMPLGSYSIA